MSVLVWAVLGYLAGSIPSAYLVATLRGQGAALADARRDDGAGDAHVLLRTQGTIWTSVAAATTDVLKALVPTLIAARVAGPYAAGACAIGAVAGHCWPPVYRRFAGRGLAAAGGGFLAIVPVEMTLGGLVTLGGTIAKVGAPVSLLGFASIPFLATFRGQPPPYRVAAWTIIALILARRLEGIGGDLRRGVSVGRALFCRVLIDAAPASEPRDGRP